MLWEIAVVGGNGMKVFRWVGLGLAAVGMIDLFWGNTSQPVLPESIGNMLNQQVDAVLILGGLGVFFLVPAKG